MTDTLATTTPHEQIQALHDRIAELEAQIATLAAENRDYERALGLNDNP